MGYTPTANDWALATIFAPSSLPPLPQVPGNIDLSKRRPWLTGNGNEVATVDSFSFEGPDNREVLVPMIGPNGGLYSGTQGYDQFMQGGQHLGIFDTPEHANAYAEWLHMKEDARTRNMTPAGWLHPTPDWTDPYQQTEMAWGRGRGTHQPALLLTHPRGPL